MDTLLALKNNGDLYEQRFGEYLSESFPSYEAFWAEFIVPMRDPDGIQLRPDVDRLLLGLAEAHYTVFWHLMTAHRLLERQAKSVDEMILLFDAVLFHLSAATEMGERVLFNLTLIESKVTGVPPAGLAPLSEQEIISLVIRYVESREYQKQLGKLESRAQTVTLPLHSKEDVYKPFLVRANALEAHKEFMSIAGEVRAYRNRIAHNPMLFKRIEADRPLVPTRNHLRKCASWAEAIESTQAGDFAPINIVEGEFLTEMERTLNDVWLALMPYCRELNSRPAYAAMLGSTSADPNDMQGASQSTTALVARGLSLFQVTPAPSASGMGGNMDSLSSTAVDPALNSPSFAEKPQYGDRRRLPFRRARPPKR